MTPVRLTECLTILNWSALRLAKITGWSEGAVRQWELGKVRIPQDVGAWLEKIARFHERNPPPARQ
jgi:transcriptional regulator with XRE-family HTH domain